jgi:hypothetical protein
MESTTVPIAMSSADREIIIGAARLQGLTLSSWLRIAAVQRSRAVIAGITTVDRVCEADPDVR